MSRENVELIRRAYEHRQREGDFVPELIAEDFVWDMSKFRGWPERPMYEGIEGARGFIREWTAAFDDWQIEIEGIHDAGADKVIGILRQRGRSKTTGLPVDMLLAQVFTIRDGKQARMEMYADPAEAFAAVGLEQPSGTEPAVEVVRRGIDAFNRGDVDCFDELTTDDFIWLPALPGAVEGGRYVGRAGIRRYFSEIGETWKRLTVECDELRDLGDRVLALGHAVGYGSGSGIAVEMPLAFIAELHGGRISRAATFGSHADALKAIGLEE